MPHTQAFLGTKARRRRQERLDVFQACRAIFTGPNARLRNKEDVRRIVADNKAVSHLCAKLGEAKLVKTIVYLLGLRVFESGERAKAQFPEIFRPRITGKDLSAGTSVDNSIVISSDEEGRNDEVRNDMPQLEVESRSEPNPEKENSKSYNLRSRLTQQTTPQRQVAQDTTPDFISHRTRAKAKKDASGQANTLGMLSPSTWNTSQIQSSTAITQTKSSFTPTVFRPYVPLFPLRQPHRSLPNLPPTQLTMTNDDKAPRLPYSAQHSVLNTTQRMLEECCFEFAKKWAPHMIASEELDCSEAIELSNWYGIFAQHLESVPREAINEPPGESIFVLLGTARKMRNSAVHRNLMPAAQVLDFVKSAVKITKALNDTTRTVQLEKLREHIQTEIRAMEESKTAIEREIRQEEEPIAAEIKGLEERIQGMRKELEVKVQDLEKHRAERRGEMLKQDRDFRAALGSRITATVETLTTNGMQQNGKLANEEEAEYEPSDTIVASMAMS